jgi:hypothetical protein
MTHFCTDGDDCKFFDVDPLIAAVIAREVAEDDYFAFEYQLRDVVENHGNKPLRGLARQVADRRYMLTKAMIDARMAAMLEADAAGLLNLFDEQPDDVSIAENIDAIRQFAPSQA